jgi:hypothetical protein
MILSEIDTATFQLILHCLNQQRYSVPREHDMRRAFKNSEWWYGTVWKDMRLRYLITFTVGPLGAHTLPPSILRLLGASTEGLFVNLPVFDSGIRLDVPPYCETCLLQAHFQNRKQLKVTRSEIRRLRWLDETCGSVRYRDAETTVSACHLSRRFLRTASRKF